MFSISCGDVMPGCAERFEAGTESDLLAAVAAHAEADHGLTSADLTPEVVGQIRAAIVAV